MPSKPFSHNRPSPSNGYLPTPEEFAAWTEHPVSRFVAAAYKAGAKAQRDEWARISWSDAPLSEVTRAVCMTRADAYMAFLETGLEGYVGMLEMIS